jgi:hypothetical protein
VRSRIPACSSSCLGRAAASRRRSCAGGHAPTCQSRHPAPSPWLRTTNAPSSAWRRGSHEQGHRRCPDPGRVAQGLRGAVHWYGTERPRFSLDRIKHPDGRWRNVAYTACRRLADAGLIETDGWNRPGDYGDWSEPYLLTEAGVRAAADLDGITDDKMFAAVKETPPEKLDRARHLRHSKKVIRALTFHGCRIRGNQVKRVYSRDNSLADVYYSGCGFDLPDAVMALLTPHLEPFVDVDGNRCGSQRPASRPQRSACSVM